MSLSDAARRFGNELYKFAFPVYRPIYKAFKIVSDQAERGLLARYAKPGSVVVDGGANIGIYSEYLAHCVGPTGMVHSFEPDSTNFNHLSNSLGDRDNVRLNRSALSNLSGTAALYISESLNVDHRTYPSDGESRRMTMIESVALDDYFKVGERVDFVKMDIQGFEFHALQGAKRVLAENQSIKLLLEFWPYGLALAGASSDLLCGLLKGHGIELFVVEKGDFQSWPDVSWDAANPKVYFNVFAMRSSDPFS